MHPLVTDIAELKISELEAKVNDLTKKYFMAQNIDLRAQIASVLETYKETLAIRRDQEYQKMLDNRNKELDNLIKFD